MNEQFRCSYKVVDSTELALEVTVRSWISYHILVSVGHPRLCVLKERTARELKKGNMKAANKWWDCHGKLMSLLVGYAVAGELSRLGLYRKIADAILTVLFVGSTYLYAILPFWQALPVDMILVGMLFSVAVFHSKRDEYLAEIKRLGFCRKLTGQKGGLENVMQTIKI